MLSLVDYEGSDSEDGDGNEDGECIRAEVVVKLKPGVDVVAKSDGSGAAVVGVVTDDDAVAADSSSGNFANCNQYFVFLSAIMKYRL